MMGVRSGLRGVVWILGLGALGAAQPQSVVRSQDAPANLNSRLELAATQAAEGADLANLTACVWLRDETVLSKAILLDKRVDADAVERERDVLWALEPLCAIALLRMADADRLSLADLLTKHLPALEFGGAHVTVAQVLTHSSGAPNYLDLLAAKLDVRDAKDVLAWLATRPLDAEPGTCCLLSPSNALIATALVQEISGEPLATALETWVLKPAGLEATAIEVGSHDVRVREATFRVGDDETDAASLARLVGVTRIRSTLPDMGRLLRLMGSGPLLSERAREDFLKAERLEGGVEAPFAYGFARSRMDREPYVSFGGAASAGALHFAWRPDANLVIALACSSTDVSLAPIAERLARVVFDVAERVVVDLPLSAEQRAIYTGVYYMGCTRTTIEARDEALYFQSPYDGPFRLRYQGDHRFVAEHDDAIELEFRVEHDRATEFVILRHGSRTGAKRME